MVVFKFGGATTRTRRGLESLVDLAREAHTRELSRRRRSKTGRTFGLVLVISAIGHTTRHLLRAAELSEQGNLAQAEESLARILSQHQQLATSLRLDSQEEIFGEFNAIATDVRALMEGIAITRELSLRTRDAIVSNGERFAATLIEYLLHERGLPVRFIDAREVVITDVNFGHAAPLLDEIEERVTRLVLPRLRRSDVVLMQGFVGATRDGLTTTMGSESSDLTATILGGALNADEVVVWKTVPGIFSADPEIVPNAKLLRLLSFDEAEEIGRRGARILFPSVAHPLLREDCSSVLRISAPNARAARHTTLQQEIEIKQEKPLALALEQHLIPIRLRHRPIDDVRQLTSLMRRKQERAREAIASAAHAWSTPLETVLLVRKDQRDGILAALDKDRFEISEQSPVSALSMIIRRPRISNTTTSFETQILRSLRQFHVRSLFPVEQSLVAVIEDSEGLAALKKLHHDVFES